MKKIVFFITFLFFFFSSIFLINAKSSYPLGESEVKQCMEAYINGGKDPDLKKMGLINNPIGKDRYLMCQGKSPQIVLYQAVLDVLFSEIDKKVEDYLKSLEGSTEYTKALFDAKKKLGVSDEGGGFDQLYFNICSGGIIDYTSSFLVKNKLGNLNTDNYTKDMIKDYDSSSNCLNLYRTKLNAYYSAAEIIITKSIISNRIKSKKTFIQKLKSQYESFLFKLTVYIGQLGIIKDKWNTATKNCNQ